MKYFIIIISILLTLSCETNPKGKISSKVSENKEIEVYDFEQLDSVFSSVTDKIVVVNFWATWCKPCIAELPYFETLQQNHKNSVKVFLVSLDFANKLESQLIPFVKKKQLETQVILLDDPYENEWIPKVDTTWTGAIPATLIIHKSGRVFYERAFSKDELEREVLKFIKI